MSNVPEVFDFCPEFINFNKMLYVEDAWQITDGEFFSTRNMSDKELREAIINDVLIVTIWEKQTNKKAKFGIKTLCRYLDHNQRSRVREQLQHQEISGLFDMFMSECLRIKDNKEILQAAMDYAGVWYTGYAPATGNDVICFDRQVIQEKIEETGGMENFINSIAMNIIGKNFENKNIH